MENLHIYISLDGNDAAAGTKELPLKTLEGAKRYLQDHPYRNATITILEGVYGFEESVLFDLANVTVEGEGDVIFSGGKKIAYDVAEDIKDEAVAKRLSDASRVKTIDVSALGLDDNITMGAFELTPHFYINGEPYEAARYPNRTRIEGLKGPYVENACTVHTPEKNGEMIFTADNDDLKAHLARWTEDSVADAKVNGYFWHQWVYSTYNLAEFDAENNTLTAYNATGSYERAGREQASNHRFFVANVLEELDDTFEYFYSKKDKKIYFIPHTELNEESEIIIALANKPAICVNNAENVTFKNIKFNYFVNEPVSVNDSYGITFENCEFAHLSYRAATVVNSSDCVFDACDIYDTASGGIYFDKCGRRYDLIPSGNEVKNCIIHDYNRIQTCYRPGVHVRSSCGVTIKNNDIFNAPHSLIIMEHVNDIMIEDNRLTNACIDTDDCAAIYWGRDPSDIGITIRHNYLANIGNLRADYSTGAIAIDDWGTGADIYNNIFYNCGIISDVKVGIHVNSNSVSLNHTQFLRIRNNIFVGESINQKPTVLFPDSAFARWILLANGVEPANESPSCESWFEVLKRAGFLTKRWKEHYQYSAWAGMWDVVNEDIQEQIREYKACHPNDSERKQFVDMGWETHDIIWDHKKPNGEHYEGKFLDMMKEVYPDDILHKVDTPEHYEAAAPTLEGSGLYGCIFWKAVIYELKFRTPNIFKNNLVVGMSRDFLDENELLKGYVMNGFQQNYIPADDKLKNGDSMFKRYGENFELTFEGLLEVHKHIPEFCNITMDSMGAKR